MSVKYTAVQMANPRDIDAEKKWYARAKSVSQDTISTIATAISEDCTPNEEDCLIVVDGIMKQIIAGLKAGKIVVIDRLGTFRLTIRNHGGSCPTVAEYLKDPSKFNAQSAIAGVNVIFSPAKELKKAIKSAAAEKYIPEEENKKHLRCKNRRCQTVTHPHRFAVLARRKGRHEPSLSSFLSISFFDFTASKLSPFPVQSRASIRYQYTGKNNLHTSLASILICCET